MLSPTYEITTALSHTDELISPPYDIAIVAISYGRVTMSSVWDSMMSKKIWGGPSTPPYRPAYKQIFSTTYTTTSGHIQRGWHFQMRLKVMAILDTVFIWLQKSKVCCKSCQIKNVFLTAMICVTSNQWTETEVVVMVRTTLNAVWDQMESDATKWKQERGAGNEVMMIARCSLCW